MPNHDRFECQTAIDSDAILHPPLPDKNEASTTDMTEQQIMQLKQKTYKAMVKDLVNRYQ
ncbi:hypothetical protein KPI97_15335 [Escherichia coli]|nr:hypothetical protein [Escherichia coli]MBU3283925.1 hypothetical protein [Escherichia coli]MBU3288961.1 hypothetical protein [Escherichia coli]MBU3293809.1 hypothetical protein [Escherichia coli]MBU3298767.1 hypothetical protein [Escherichia coli]